VFWFACIEMSLHALLANHEDDAGEMIPEYIKNAPKAVRNRIAALNKLMLKNVEIQADFYRRVHELETEFRSRYDAVNQQRAAIINGKYEPAENECDVKLFSWMSDEDVHKFDETAAASGDEQAPEGIPDFWLNVLRQSNAVSELITAQDEPILRHLTDITTDQTNDPAAFTLKFHFSENEYFSNSVLTKYYKLSIGPNGYESEILYDGPSIVSCEGCKIDWKQGKNVCEKTIKKKQKKGSHAGKSVNKVVPAESFFRFFSPEIKEVEKDLDDESADLLNADFQAGQSIRDVVIDSAVLLYTGEAAEEEDFDYGAEDEEGLEHDTDDE